MQNTLKAWIRKNHLTEDTNDYAASVISNGSVTTVDIIKALVEEGMEIKSETATDIISRFNRKASEFVLSGYNVSTGLVYMRPVIKGVFYDKTWSSETNPVYIAMNQGTDLKAAVCETVVQILGVQSDPLTIESITDCSTGKTDGTLSHGRNVEIKGSYLKIVGTNPDCGITLKNIVTQVITKLAAIDIVINQPSRLLILLPYTLDKGEYELNLTTQFTGGNTLLKAPRSILFDFPITIV